MAEQRVIPMLSYEDVGRAADWIAQAFGFEETGIGQRQYRAEDIEGHRWMFAEPLSRARSAPRPAARGR